MKLFWGSLLLFSAPIGLTEVRAAVSIPPADILRKVDEVRSPSEDFTMIVKVISKDASEDPKLFEVLTSGADRTVVRTLEPAGDKKRDLLMIKQSMWAYIPNLGRSVLVSLSQKLTGDAANGDISRMRWADDYSYTVESETPDSWTLAMTALKDGLTYEKIRAKIEKNSFHPLTADYLTKDGVVLKTAVFSDYKSLAGSMRPAKVEIQDAVRADKKTTIEIQKISAKKIAASVFSAERFGAQ